MTQTGLSTYAILTSHPSAPRARSPLLVPPLARMQDETVTVFGHFLHMHATGRHMVTYQFRDDVLINTARVEYYSFDQGGGFNPSANGTETIKVRKRPVMGALREKRSHGCLV